VRVINFIAKGTIEEGMLSVLAFKRSLSAGILDGGIGEISLGGSRLNRFMKEVENVTRRMGESEAVTPAEEAGNSGGGADDVGEEGAKAEAPQAPLSNLGSDPWLALIQVGAQLVSALAAANDPEAPPHPWIERDAATGVQSLKIPVPPRETAQRLADALSALADGLRGGTV
jgi:hypothetical protein